VSEVTTQEDINCGLVNIVPGFTPLEQLEFVVIIIQILNQRKLDASGIVS